MKKIKAHCGIGFAGAEYEEEFEFDDDMTDDEMNNFWKLGGRKYERD